MYDLNDLHIKESHTKSENAPIFRVLLEQEGSNSDEPNQNNINHNEPSNIKESGVKNDDENIYYNPVDSDSSVTNNKQKQQTDQIHINGMGVAGIGVSILFLIPILIGCFVMMGIFVNTKFIDQPIRIKIME